MLPPERLSQLLSELADGDRTPADLASRFGISEEALFEHALSDSVRRHLASRAQLRELRAQMLLSRFRANVVLQLVTIATAETPTELARRACVDLLTLQLGSHERRGASREDAADAPLPAPTEEAILKALEALGAEIDAERA
jgi:hypothetical protein